MPVRFFQVARFTEASTTGLPWADGNPATSSRNGQVLELQRDPETGEDMWDVFWINNQQRLSVTGQEKLGLEGSLINTVLEE